MLRSLSTLVVILILLGAACSCPSDEKVGDLNLTAAAQAFLPYNGNEELVFIDETGQSLQLTVPQGREVQENRLCTRTTCTEAKFGSPSSCEYYAAESHRYTFRNADGDMVIDLLLYTEVYKRTDATFYDAFQVAFSTGTSSIVGHHVIEGRFSEPIMLSEINLTDFFTEEANLVLNNQSFDQVLRYEEGELAIYVKEGVGVVGFKNAEHSWVLQQ